MPGSEEGTEVTAHKKYCLYLSVQMHMSFIRRVVLLVLSQLYRRLFELLVLRE